MSLPVYHYLDIGRLGRGEVLNLFLKDAGIEVKQVRYPMDATWPQQSETLKAQGISRTGKVPSLEYKGQILTQHIPTLRYLARDIGGYDGETNWERYVVDAVADIYIDWRSQWVANLGQKNPDYKDYVPGYYSLVAQYYSDYEGPYLLGDRVTYVDFAIYQSIDNDARTGTLPAELPDVLVRFKETFEQRPRIAEYIKQNS
ncbi:glutathione S-transferase [Aspergillus steynii IBT 23096]|uniref:Glutathione S-transferase n=1 Tax=Aspergillus steynii IBT 23096 TaxID=1392250 RepID=A0A2I2GB23_9EURO|nr:glutathione S-transferase [Aspergillus steynii IBT 23096]PLB50082.1 glutathione S-transferase [Aspergillus steynii IBT 23096]